MTAAATDHVENQDTDVRDVCRPRDGNVDKMQLISCENLPLPIIKIFHDGKLCADHASPNKLMEGEQSSPYCSSPAPSDGSDVSLDHTFVQKQSSEQTRVGYVRKKCAVEQCSRRAKRGGKCIAHGGGQCIVAGCSTGARENRMCRLHNRNLCAPSMDPNIIENLPEQATFGGAGYHSYSAQTTRESSVSPASSTGKRSRSQSMTECLDSFSISSPSALLSTTKYPRTSIDSPVRVSSSQQCPILLSPPINLRANTITSSPENCQIGLTVSNQQDYLKSHILQEEDCQVLSERELLDILFDGAEAQGDGEDSLSSNNYTTSVPDEMLELIAKSQSSDQATTFPCASPKISSTVIPPSANYVSIFTAPPVSTLELGSCSTPVGTMGRRIVGCAPPVFGPSFPGYYSSQQRLYSHSYPRQLQFGYVPCRPRIMIAPTKYTNNFQGSRSPDGRSYPTASTQHRSSSAYGNTAMPADLSGTAQAPRSIMMSRMYNSGSQVMGQAIPYILTAPQLNSGPHCHSFSKIAENFSCC